MKTGMAMIFQNPEGCGRDDREVYTKELALGAMAEPLGFQSLWIVEHHFTDYTMCPNVAQFLSYFAGRTKDIELGLAVIVLPWHDPMRVAEEVTMLDHMSNGRMILGVGRVPLHDRCRTRDRRRRDGRLIRASSRPAPPELRRRAAL